MKTFISKFNGKEYNTAHMVNYSRYVMKQKPDWTIEDFYNYEFDCDIPVCEMCGEKVKFKSFSDGYYKHCTKCRKENSLNALIKNTFIDGYDNFLKNNYEKLYKENWKSKKFIDPYDNIEYSGTLTFSRHVFKTKCKRNINDSFWNVSKKCEICGDDFSSNMFKNKTLCHTCAKKYGLNKETKDVHVSLTNYEAKLYGEKIELLTDYTDFIKFITDNQLWKHKHLQKYIPSRDYRRALWNDIIKTRHCNFILDYVDSIPVFFFYNEKKNIYLPVLNRGFKFFTEKNVSCETCGKQFTTNVQIFHTGKKLEYVYDNKFCSPGCYHKSMQYRPYNEHTGNLISKKLKERIATGTFTPCIINSLTRKAISISEYPNNKFRSSWELAFWYLNKDALDYASSFEKLRIQYFSTVKNKNRTYIVDFIDMVNKIVYEIKPSSKVDDEEVQNKLTSLEKWCNINKYSLQIIDETYFIQKIESGETFDFLEKYQKNILQLKKRNL